MKTSIVSLILVTSLIIIGSSDTLALTIDDVSINGIGAPDSIFYYDNVSPSSSQKELEFISAGLAANFGITFDPTRSSLTKWDFSEPGDDNYDPSLDYNKFWTNLSDAQSLWAFDFYVDAGQHEPEYFLIKTGKQVEYQGGYFNHFLYENLGSLQYGVVDLNAFGQNGIDLYKISHVSIPAPEPSTFLLLGCGLVGIAFIIRRRKNE